MRKLSGPVVALAVFGAVWAGAASLRVYDVRTAVQFAGASGAIPVEMPETAPLLDQESINAALVAYNIHVPPHVRGPEFDELMRDRGLTIRGPSERQTIVAIGPAAFDSWALLGSTLAHELEVHCQQNFPLIALLDFLGLSGTEAAERQAYQYELANVARFGLGSYDRSLVEATMTYYYPEGGDARSVFGAGAAGVLSHRLQTWLAAQILPQARR